MKYSREQLKQLIIQEMCGPSHGEHMPNGNMGSAAVQHPADISKGDMSGHKEDHEGKMALAQLGQIMQNADTLQSIVGADDSLQAWVQSKLTKAADYLDTVKKYMEFESAPNMPVAISLGEQKVEVTKAELRQIIKEMLISEEAPVHTNLPPETEYEFVDVEGRAAPIPGSGRIGLDLVNPEDPEQGYTVAKHHQDWHRQNPGNPVYYRRARAPGLSDEELMSKWGKPNT